MYEEIREEGYDQYPIKKDGISVQITYVHLILTYSLPLPSYSLNILTRLCPLNSVLPTKQYAHIRIASEYTKSEESMTPLSDQTILSIKIHIKAKGNFCYLRNSNGSECLFLVKTPLSKMVRERLIDRSSTLY